MILNEALQNWSNIINEEYGVKDQNKRSWMAQYARNHEIYESVQGGVPGVDAGIYATPLNTLGMGNPMMPQGVGFDNAFLAKRTFVGCLLNKWDANTQSKKEFVEMVERFCDTLDKDFVEKIQNTKGSRGESKEGVINAELNPYWDEFLKNDGKVESAA